MAPPARLTALRMLARRELSAAQLRGRLARRGFEDADIDAALETLRADGSLDDLRAARAIAHAETTLKHRGPARVRRQLEAAGIASELAARVVGETFAEIDADALLARALARARRGHESEDETRAHRRLYRRLLAQGFEPDRILTALNTRHRLE